ncbi:hypothetical protein AZE42_11493 [Rhizopogon vesiculosus]|uniref:Uncharacterized protein n=1 Tax=Rhizopogon vesiculosus TaxID=180088 RepID=A0A1J8Q409_9AGAM|nr:hypothetical protein AZE42_11493 [Rhizopogon vesiculosus]
MYMATLSKRSLYATLADVANPNSRTAGCRHKDCIQRD